MIFLNMKGVNMEKKKSLLLIIILLVILLGLWNLMFFQETKTLETSTRTTHSDLVSPQLQTRHVDLIRQNDIFYPVNIEANKGDKLILNIISLDNYSQIIIDEFDVNTRIKSGVIELNLDREGVFSYFCSNCKNKLAGSIIVY
jgi:type II secretory pathway component PulC